MTTGGTVGGITPGRGLDEEAQQRLVNILQARLSWKQAEACVRDLEPTIAALIEQSRADGRERITETDQLQVVEEQEFLAASVAVWREIDRLSGEPTGYQGLDASTELRLHERAAWEAYRDVLDARTLPKWRRSSCGAVTRAPRDLLEALVDSDDCWFDHHGGCQAHGYLRLRPGEICPQQQLKDLLRGAP